MTRFLPRSVLSLLLPREATLQHRVLQGGVWLLGADLANRVIGLLKMALLARLLAPRDFGMMGVATLVISWFDLFTQTGFSLALIRKPGDVRPYLHTMWTVQAFRGILLAVGIFVAAPAIAVLFHSPEVAPIVRVVGLLAVMRGLANPAIVYLRKELKMKQEVLWRVGGTLIGLVVAIPLAFWYRNAWTLVASTLAAAAGELLLSYRIAPFLPRLELDWSKAREMMRFGKWIFWSNAATYLSLYADSWVLGHFLGTTSIGYYQVAQQIGMTPVAQVGGHISTVALPAFSKLEPGAQRPAFLRAVRFVSTVLFPLGTLVTVASPVLVRVVLGGRWMPVTPLLSLLVWAGVLSALSCLPMAFLHAANRPDLSAWAVFLKFLGFAVLVYPLMQLLGVPGVALAALLSSPINFCYQYLQAARVLGWRWDLLLVFRPAVLASAPVLGAALLIPFSGSIWIAAFIDAVAAMLSAALVFTQLRTLFRPPVVTPAEAGR